MKIVLFGYDELLLAALKTVQKLGAEVIAVVFPSTQMNDSRVAQVRAQVARQGLKCITQPPRQRSAALAEKLRRRQPDLILAWSYPMILPPDILTIPWLGCVNLHMGLLPEYRGGNGLIWALLQGEQGTGVTLHYMVPELDAGSIIGQHKIPITAQDTGLTLLQKAHSAGQRCLQHYLPKIATGTVPSIDQNETEANYYPPLTDQQRKIDWSESAVQIVNRVRAFAPPLAGAYAYWNHQKIIIKQAQIHTSQLFKAPLGKIIGQEEETLQVICNQGSVNVTLADHNLLQNIRIGDFFSAQ